MLDIDRKHIWHPFTQAQTATPVTPIVQGRGAYLMDQQGHEYIDMVSSWWVNIHGHAHPKIAQAIATQALQLEHVMFAGFTHAPALQLAEKLYAKLPSSLTRFFFSDNGSTAVEIALKMAYQYWYNRKDTKRQRFLAFQGAYHGDTFGAMATGKSSGLYKAFEPLLMDVHFLDYPATWENDADVTAKESLCLAALDQYLVHYGAETAAFIAEPLVQGAAGMRFCRPAFLHEVITRLKQYDILVIFDEVMTGFGRTGSLFALEQVGIAPDLLCLSKGLTGGFLPMALTIATEPLYQAFLGETTHTALLHGHSYTANPLGCAAALASLALFEEENTLKKIQHIARWHQKHMAILSTHHAIEKTRIMGSIAAFDLPANTSLTATKIRQSALEGGIILRPIGNVVYMLSPYCITEEAMAQCYQQLQLILATE
jgi:adenosylmethionine-8-amino-7-oxononanoate aminotransferase